MSRAVYIPILLALVLALFSCSTISPITEARGQDAGDERPEDDRAQTPDVEEVREPAAQSESTTAPDEDTTDVRAAGNLAVRPIAAGTQCAVRVPVQAVVTSNAVFQDVWATIHGNVSNPPKVPDVDFGRETVVVLVLGERPTAGYSVRVVRARSNGNTIEVVLRVESPSPGSVTAQVVTSPYQIVAVAAAGQPVTFTGDDVRDGYDPY